MIKTLSLLSFLFLSLYADFNYYGKHSLDEFKDFKVYQPKSRYFTQNLSMQKGELSQETIQHLNKLYSYEKMVRDLLLVLSQKYDYNFMQYVAMLTHTHLLALNQFYKKYDLTIPESIEQVGVFNNQETINEYKKLLADSLKEKKIAAKLSVGFMKNLVTKYEKTSKNLPIDFKRQLLKTNAFNKKILRMFKKGLRNIELGLPVE